jgi:hypothetical protein
MGALFVYTFETGMIKQPNVRSQFIRILTVNIIISLMPGISLLGHLGGFVGGVLLGVIFTRNDAWSMLRKNTIVATLGLLLALVIWVSIIPISLRYTGRPIRKYWKLLMIWVWDFMRIIWKHV